MTHTAADYVDQLQQLLPPGIAWPRNRDAVLTQLLQALADGLARADASATTLLTEADPRRTLDLLPEWEQSAGLPDPCVKDPQTLEQRRQALVTRLTATGGASASYFESIAASLGYHSAVEDVATHVWRINTVEDVGVTYARAGQAVAGDPIRDWGLDRLECVINRLKPAHTRCLFAYGVNA